MGSCVRWLLVSWTLVGMTVWLAVSGQLFSDERAGTHIDDLSRRGIQTLLSIRKRFLRSISAINDTLNEAEYLLNNDFNTAYLPNLTAYAESQLVNVNYKLTDAETLVSSLNLTDQGDGLVSFMKNPTDTVNVGGAYDPNNRAGGTFTVPRRGLYQVIVRTTVGSGVSIAVMRNNNETITTVDHQHYYDIKIRVVLLWLNEGDEVFTTGNEPSYFGVMLLNLQDLMPRFV